MNTQSEPDTRLHSRRLLIARLVWGAVSILALAYFAILIQSFDDQLTSFASIAGEEVSPALLQSAAIALVAVPLVYYAVAGIVAWRRFDDWMALFVSLTLILFGPVTISFVAVGEGNPTRLDLFDWRRLLDSLIHGAGWACLVWFFLLFPNGRLVPREMRWPAIMWTVFALSWPMFPAIDPYTDSSWGFRLLLFLVIPVIGALVQIHRYEHVITPIERQQTRLVLFGFGAAVLGIFMGFSIASPEYWLVRLTIFVCSFILIPLPIGVAILRYRLFDTDVIIRQALVSSLLTVTVALGYITCILLLQQMLAPLTGGSEIAIVASTLAIAALFTPLRRRIQNLIDRRFFRRKYDAAKVLAAFGATARDETNLEHLTTAMLRVVDDTVQPEFVGLWLREPES